MKRYDLSIFAMRESTDNVWLRIFSNDIPSSQALRFVLAASLGVKCSYVPKGTGQLHNPTLSTDRGTINVFDCLGLDSDGLGALIGKDIDTVATTDTKTILYNVDERIDPAVLNTPIVWGVLYRNDSQTTFLDCLRAVLKQQPLKHRHPPRRHDPPNGAMDVSIPQAHALSSRETQILRLIAQGIGNDAIAAKLGITVPTVKTHVYRCFRKLGVNTRLQLIQRIADWLPDLMPPN